MSEIISNGSFVTPDEQDFNTLGFQGSMQQVLSENLGSYVVVDFVIGTGNLVTRQGILYYVGAQFLVLYDDVYLSYIVCDMFSIKFVTFLMPGCRTADTVQMTPHSMGTSALQQLPTGTSGAMNSAGPMNEAQQQAQTPSPQPDPAMTPAQAAYAHAIRRPGRPVTARNA